MSRYKQFEIGQVKDYPLDSRPSKVDVGSFTSPLTRDSFSAFVESLPRVLAADQLRLLVGRIREARHRQKPIIWAFGGHVIKVGLAPILIDLMAQGFVTSLATNGKPANC